MPDLADRRAKIAGALQVLGDTTDHVADTLTRFNIRGKPGDGTACPIARYLSEAGVLNLADPGEFVGRMFVHIGLDTTLVGNSASVPLPTPVFDFLTTFDASADKPEDCPWPHLLERPIIIEGQATPTVLELEAAPTAEQEPEEEPRVRTPESRRRTRTRNNPS